MKNMSPNQIRILLLEKGVSQAAIARAEGLSKQAINIVIRGLSSSDRVRKAIARHTDTDVTLIWPEIYLRPDGPPKPGRPRHAPL